MNTCAKLSKEILEQEYLSNKKSMGIIANEYGVDRRTVAYWIDKFNIPRRAREEERLNKLMREKGFNLSIETILDLVSQGYFVQDIAKQYNVSRDTIGNILKRNGVNLRNHLAQRQKQSERMTIDNPVPKGSIRDRSIINAMLDARKKQYFERINSWIEDKETYAKLARSYAYASCGHLPDNLCIDHLFSIEDGYNYKIPINQISHPNNLRICTYKENLAKHSCSIITLEDFYKIVGIQRLFYMEVASSGAKSGEQSNDC